MNILIVTQVVDTNHPGLGFFHNWISTFAKHCEKVTVICLEAGEHDLPENVRVVSLGKENGATKFQYLSRFFTYIYKYRSEYDGVFIHMNQIYAILGGLLWFVLRKPVGLWYTHGTVSTSLRVALRLVKVVFTASPESFRIKSKKVQVVGHGIDTNLFSPQATKKDIDVITIGRITASKNLLVLINAVATLSKQLPVSLTLVGAPVTEAEEQYDEEIRTYVAEHQLESVISWHGKATQVELPLLLSRSKVFATTSTTGSLDKAVLEAMAVGTPVVSMATGTQTLPLGDNQTDSEDSFVAALQRVISAESTRNEENISFVATEHSLDALVQKMLTFYSK